MSAPERAEVSRAFAARYEGQCARDGCERFEEGDLIRRLAHPHNGLFYVHDECPDVVTALDALEVRPFEVFCSRCNMYHRGECL
jgi:hypothetical protein